MSTIPNLFDYEDIEQTPSNEIKIEKLTEIEYSDVLEFTHDEVLDKIKALLDEGIIKQTDKYFRFILGVRPEVKKASLPYAHNEYILLATYWSDSAVYLDVFNHGQNDMTTREFLNTCSELGAYTKMAWEYYGNNSSCTPEQIIEKYRIREHVKHVIVANGSKEDCERAHDVLIEWNRNHIKSLEELQKDKKYDFIRVTRKKGEITHTKCMDGECIGGVLTREVAW